MFKLTIQFEFKIYILFLSFYLFKKIALDAKGDDYCDAECDVPECLNDRGDCSLVDTCDSTCEMGWVGKIFFLGREGSIAILFIDTHGNFSAFRRRWHV